MGIEDAALALCRREDSMKNGFSAAVAIAAGLMSGASLVAMAHAQETLSIPNNDSIYIDGGTVKVSSGKAKGDLSAQLKKIGARELGQGAIVFRASDKLYIIEANAGAERAFAYDQHSDPRRFMYDQHSDPQRFAVDPNRPYAYDPGDSRRFAVDPNRPYAYDPGD